MAPFSQVDFVRRQIEEIKRKIEEISGSKLLESQLAEGIREANRIRECLDELRFLVFTADRSPLPALEMLIAEMLAIHFCSDRNECLHVLTALLKRVKERINNNLGFGTKETVRIFWVNPVADLRAMNLLEECGGRICGTDYLFLHSLEEIPDHLPPLEALARTALADPMVGPAKDRALRICSDIRRFGAEAVIVSKIPGASHCATEGQIITEEVRSALDLPVLEIEIPPISDAMRPSVKNRLQALIETARQRRSV